MMERITYVWHDCFVAEMPGVNVVFDYWLDEHGRESMPEAVARLDRTVPLLVLVSHSHKDHYNPAIFGWASEFADVHYVVSADVWRRMRHVVSETSVYAGPKVEASRVTMLRPGMDVRIMDIKVQAFGSTDTGCSYMVSAAGRRLFHAGDLNAWIWLDDSTPAEVAKAMGDYRACLRDIKKAPGGELPIDYCFFPVDSRIGREYWRGAQMFVREFDVRHFFAMHFALGSAEERDRRCRDAMRYELYANPERGEYIPLCVPGTSFVRGAEGIC